MYNTGVSNQDIATVDDVLPIFKLQKLRQQFNEIRKTGSKMQLLDFFKFNDVELF